MGGVLKTVGKTIGGAISAVGGSALPERTVIEGGAQTRAEAERLRKVAEERSKAAQEQRKQLIESLQGQARGTSPSLAEAQLKAAQDRTLAQQVAAARAQRGGSPAALQRTLARSQAEAGQALAQQSAQAKIQEQAQAQQLLAQQVAQEQALSDQLTQGFLGQGFDVGRQQAILDAQRREGGTKVGQAIVGGALQGGASALKYFTSDKDKKKNIKKEKKGASKDFLDKIQAVSYDYKNPKEPGAAEGRRHGILAQDLEKSEIGKSLVKNTKSGKSVDIAQGFGAVLAAQSDLNKRISELEKLKKKRG